MGASVGEKAARGAAWNVIAGVATRAFGLIGTLVLTRFVAPSEFGEISAAQICVLTAAHLLNMRFGQYVIAKRAPPSAIFQANVIHMVLGFVGVSFVVAFRDEIGPMLDAPGMSRFVPGFVAAILIERAGNMPERTLVRDLRFRELSVARSVGEVGFLVVALGLAPTLGGMALVLANVARAALATGMFMRAAHWSDYGKPAPFEWKVVREMFVYCIPYSIGAIAEYASSRWDNLLVSRFFGPRQLGMYNLAYNLADTPTATVGEHIGDVLFPSFAKLPENRRKDALVRASRLMSLLVFPLAIGLAAVSPTLVRALFDERWRDVAPMLAILSAFSVSKVVGWSVMSFMQSQHRQRPLMVLSGVKIAMLLAVIYLVGRYGPLWTCVAVGITFALNLFAAMFVVSLLDGIPSTRIYAGVLPILLACGVMWLAVVGVRTGLTNLGFGAGVGRAVVLLVAEILVGAAAYVAAAFVFARSTALDLLTQVRRILKRRRGEAED